MKQSLKVLIIEDLESEALSLARQLEHEYDPLWERVDTAEGLSQALKKTAWDVVLCNQNLLRFDFMAALTILKDGGLDLPFIIVSGSVVEEGAAVAMKAGAHDYILKNNLSRLLPVIQRELREAREHFQRKRLEDQLRQAQKMEAIGRLAGGVAHDFNNLLTVIQGYAEMMEKKLPAGDVTRGPLGEIQSAAKRAATLTRQLLIFSRKQEINLRPVCWNDLILNMERMLKRLVMENVELVTHLSPNLWSMEADPGQLEQVIANLVVNASDAMPLGGKLIIETANVFLTDEYAAERPDLRPGEYVICTVSDTGVGMTPEIKARLFEPFFTTKPPEKGTGLGLAISFGIVKQIGGHIAVYTEPGKGSAFKIYLPRVEKAAEIEVQQEPAGALPRGTENVFIVEDDQAIRTLASGVLRAQGYQVWEASNGFEALHWIEGKNPPSIDLLLTDLVMPQMSGVKLMKKLKASYPHIKVLFTSGYTEDVIFQHGIPPGTPFIQKPFSPRALTLKVRETLESSTIKLS
jgi:signal transduction histidine kinase